MEIVEQLLEDPESAAMGVHLAAIAATATGTYALAKYDLDVNHKTQYDLEEGIEEADEGFCSPLSAYKKHKFQKEYKNRYDEKYSP